MECLVKKNSSNLEIIDPISKYIMGLNSGPLFRKGDFVIYFEIPNKRGCGCPGIVTGRSYSRYPREFRKIDSNFQYIEVGAGLAGYLPFISSKCNLQKKPIVIDPVNYSILQSMIFFVKENKLVKEHTKRRLETLLRRSEFYTSDRIILINQNLHDAIRDHTEIIGLGDVVVDFKGSTLWPEMTSLEDLENNSCQELLNLLKKKP